MNRRTTATLSVIIIGATGVSLPRMVSADERSKETQLTFAHDVAVPGRILPAGTYVFRLADLNSTRHVVQVFEPGGRLLATCPTVPVERTTASDSTSIVFVRDAGTAAPKIQQWYYPGQRGGEEFLYLTRRTGH